MRSVARSLVVAGTVDVSTKRAIERHEIRIQGTTGIVDRTVRYQCHVVHAPVSAIGDVTAISLTEGKFLPKGGVFAEGEAKVVVQNIASGLAGKPMATRFDGKGACFVELGDGRAAFASGSLYGADGPTINLRHPGRYWHWTKVAFEQYWMRRWL